MQNYPIFMNLRGQRCLVVGGGLVALRKIERQILAGAHVTVVAPQICVQLANQLGTQITHLEREFKDSDIQSYTLITAATNNHQVNARISRLAQESCTPVNVVDQPELCSFITPSMIDRSPVTIAISTGGNAPILARLLRAKLEAIIPAGFGRLAEKMGHLREKVKHQYSNGSDRRKFWEALIEGPISEKIFSGQHVDESDLLTEVGKLDPSISVGEVWLIGAGPGDPDLLTFKALRLMQRADVVLYDRLVSSEVLALCRHDAEKIYVGKKRADHTLPQQDINQQLVDLALKGNKVVRLKGGDPFIFGRGGEEIELLHEHDIAFQVVPGITAAAGCASYAGIPLTHRDHAQSCLFVTGHLKDGSVDLNWQQLSLPNQTVVIYMGLVGLPHICKSLIKQGVSEQMPIALIERGTTAKQRVFCATLGTIETALSEQQVHAPTLLIIGQVVSLRDQLNWYQTGDGV